MCTLTTVKLCIGTDILPTALSQASRKDFLKQKNDIDKTLSSF